VPERRLRQLTGSGQAPIQAFGHKCPNAGFASSPAFSKRLSTGDTDLHLCARVELRSGAESFPDQENLIFISKYKRIIRISGQGPRKSIENLQFLYLFSLLSLQNIKELLCLM
jgi:hypothetical protein